MDEILVNEFTNLLKLQRNICFTTALKTDDGIVIENNNKYVSNTVSIKEICDIEEKLTPYKNLLDIQTDFDSISIAIR